MFQILSAGITQGSALSVHGDNAGRAYSTKSAVQIIVETPDKKREEAERETLAKIIHSKLCR